MKTVLPVSRKSSRRASTLILGIVMTAVLGVVLTAYLALVSGQNVRTMRSQAWNSAIAVVEAGLEDALTHLNLHGTTDLLCDGWQETGGIYYMKRWVGDAYYVVTISNWTASGTTSPVIESRGYVPVPMLVAGLPGPVIADASGGGGATTPTQNYLARGVRVKTQGDYLFAKGLVARDQIDLNGNNIDTDSFDSSDPLYSTGGRYDPLKNKDEGDVATNSSLTNSLNIGNANIRGSVSTGPGGSCTIGPNGSVGTKAWVDGGNTGIQPGHKRDDMNVDFKDVEPPFTGGAFTPSGGKVDGTNYVYVLGTGNYQLANFSLKSKEMMAVTGDAVLYVTSGFSMSGQSAIRVLPGGRLRLYVAAASASIGGNGVANGTGNATNFFYYGLPSNTSISFSGNGEFVGVIYAPNADLTMNGGGSGAMDFIGAAIAKTITMNGHYNFHYDEALRKYGPFRGFIVTSWDEMTPDEVASGPPIDYSPNGALN